MKSKALNENFLMVVFTLLLDRFHVFFLGGWGVG